MKTLKSPQTPGSPARQGRVKAAKPLSEAKLQANRANAQKSTGPRTPSGKSRSARNALTHGLTSSLNHGLTAAATYLTTHQAVASRIELNRTEGGYSGRR